MIDVTKVHMMTKLATYEKEKGKKELKMHRYSRTAYLSLKLIEGFLAVTFGFLLGAGLYMMRYYTNIMMQGLAFSYGGIFRHILMAYGGILVISLILIFVIESRRYRQMIESVKQYDKDLFTLKRYLEKEEELQ